MNENQVLLKEITDLKDAYFNLLSSLYKLSEAISFKYELDEIFKIILDILKNAKPYYFGSLFLIENNEFVLKYSVGNSEDEKRVIKLSKELFPWIIRGKKKVSVFPDLEDDVEVENSNVVMIPILFQEEILGIICLLSNIDPDKFLKQDMELFTIIGNQTGIALQNAILYQEMEDKNLELGNLKNYLENILDNMANPVIVTTYDGFITTFNHEAEIKFGKSSNDAIKSHFSSLFSKEAYENISIAMKNAGDLTKSEITEIIVEIDGKSVPMEINVSSLIDLDKKVSGFILVLRDLSQTKEIERLKELDKMKSELISNVSHELRTPLTSIMAYSETLYTMIEEKDEDFESQKEFLSIISKEAERLTNLITELLTMSKLESKKANLKIESFELCNLLNEILSILSEVAKKKNILIDLRGDCDFYLINDREKIKQILVNLVGNAIKYNRKDGKIRLKILNKDNICRILVIDNGYGIQKELREKVFERFYRADSSLTYEESGTGLGLSICKDLAELCGGNITLWSKFGMGSIFKLDLPLGEL